MSNADLARRVVAAWNGGDMDTVVDYYDEHCEMFGPEEWPETGPFRGRDGVRRQFEVLTEPWKAQRTDIEEIREHVDTVVMRAVWRAQGASGLQMEYAHTQVATFRDGRIVRHAFFANHDEALRAAGLDQPD